MKYDDAFLRLCGLLDSPIRGSLEHGEYTIEYYFDKTSRLVYARIPETLSSHEALRLLLGHLLFDYAWIVGDDLHVARTYGYRRSFHLTNAECSDPLSPKVRLLARLNHSSIHTLFMQEESDIQLNSDLAKSRSRLAHLVGGDSTLYEKALSVQQIIERLIVLLFLESEARAPKKLLRELRASLSVWHDMKELVLSDRVGLIMRDRFEPPEPVSREEWNSALADLVDVLSNHEWSLDPWKSSSESVTPAILEEGQEQFVAPIISLNGRPTSSSKDPRNVARPSRTTGSYFTPEHIAHYIASRSLAGWIEDVTAVDVYEPGELSRLHPDSRSRLRSVLEDVRVLDPACGAGVFLRCAADWICGLWELLGQEEELTHIYSNVVSRNISGADIMPSAARVCCAVLCLWAISQGVDEKHVEQVRPVVKTCNSLVEEPFAADNAEGGPRTEKRLYDVIIGNPPYGNIMSVADRRLIESNQDDCVGGGRTGTWSVSAHFLVRARRLLSDAGWLGLLVPNSILRVKQFEKTRRFLLENANLVEVVDEASPFRQVTLEMVSVFAKAGSKKRPSDVRVISRRPDLPRLSVIPARTLSRVPMILLYRDEILDAVQDRGEVLQITATRGRDLGKGHTSRTRSDRFSIPYASRGRSVVHYGLSLRHLDYADDSFNSDTVMRHSYENEYLVATKNLPYPRCAIKPKGVIHGGGVVRLQLCREDVDSATMGLILNSKLVRYLSVRHFTNYSQLTTCLNTGIMENIPVVYPKDPRPFSILFGILTSVRGRNEPQSPMQLSQLQSLADSLVYELYLSDTRDLQSLASEICRSHLGIDELTHALTTSSELRMMVHGLSSRPEITAIDRSPRTEVLVSQMPMLK